MGRVPAPWALLLFILHLRATGPGLAYSGYGDWAGWAGAQAFFAGVLVLLGWAVRQAGRGSRRLGAAAGVLGILLALAGWAARASGDTFRVLAAEAGGTPWRMLASSARSAADPGLAADLLLALAAAALAWRWRPGKALEREEAASWAVLGVALAVAGAAWKPCEARLESPLLALMRSAGPELRPAAGARVSDINSLRHGRREINPELRRDLQARRAEFARFPGKKPNVVLVVLESVGGPQVRPGGRWDPALTPELSRLAGGGVFFSRVYVPYPGTVRSHVSLMTGGGLLTWGSVYKQLSYRFLGPTLPGELKSRGYRTGVFSSAYLNSENMEGFYGGLPFDEKYFPELKPKAYQDAHQLNSWGVDDRETAAQALDWARQGAGPFFMVLNLDATHHPYTVPKDLKPFRAGGSDAAHYAAALHYLDGVVGGLARGLQAAGRGDTLLVVTGDHGEAFGDLHPGNYTHRNFLYEENLRSFALFADLLGPRRPFEADFAAGNGELLASVLELVDQRERPGSLFSPRERIRYFFKNAYPELWGLKDGPWKFIEPMLRGGTAELYRLDEDPGERRNLAAERPDLVKEYHELAAQWYVDAEDGFEAELEGYRFAGGRGLAATDLEAAGPKRLAFGTVAEDGSFHPAPEVRAGAQIAAYTLDVPYPKGRELTYRWLGPDGAERVFTFFHKPEWSEVYVYPKETFRMAPGLWRLAVCDGARELVSGRFSVLP